MFDWCQTMEYNLYDVIINTLPATRATKNLFNKTFFSQCSNTIFINVGRGESVSQEALLNALDTGHVKKAILDVFEEEPLPRSSPLWSHAGVIITPHHASKTTTQDMETSFAQIVKAMKTNTTNDLFVDLSRGY